MWTVAELELAICGSPEIPVAAIRDSARFETSRDNPHVKVGTCSLLASHTGCSACLPCFS